MQFYIKDRRKGEVNQYLGNMPLSGTTKTNTHALSLCYIWYVRYVCVITLSILLSADIALDWSDHALWWPDRNRWLLRARSTLDQYNVQADARLHFTPMHKNLKVQLPDLQTLELRVDFSTKCFATVVQTCKDLGEYCPVWEWLFFFLLRSSEILGKQQKVLIVAIILTYSLSSSLHLKSEMKHE